MVSPGTNVVVHAVIGMLALPLIFRLLKTHYTMLDIVLACVPAALLTLVPTVGEALSLVTMVAVLNYRISENLFPGIVVPVMVARLLMIPVLLVFELHKQM
nr:hypothetical protein [Dyella sp. ASV24]